MKPDGRTAGRRPRIRAVAARAGHGVIGIRQQGARPAMGDDVTTGWHRQGPSQFDLVGKQDAGDEKTTGLSPGGHGARSVGQKKGLIGGDGVLATWGGGRLKIFLRQVIASPPST